MIPLVALALAEQPPELGIVAFSRGYDAAAARAKAEGKLGRVEGVTSTRTGFVKGREVVEVTHAGDVKALDAAAAARGYSALSGALSPSLDDDKKQLQGTRFRFVPLTPLQKTRINAGVRDGEKWLSPRQLERLRSGSRDVLQVDDVVEAWATSAR
ncbi:MAG: hypothetical protein JNK82_29785 [Myxococcaceae bacterium]|nr:hypothetical protein [Myxococcaceae bacterium]